MAEKKKAGKAMSYRGKPLARCGNVLYLGNLSASHFVMMQVIQTEKLEDLSVPQKVAVQLIAGIPEGASLQRSTALGQPLEPGTLAFKAVDNLARRILGEQVPLAVC